jgi:hypothetical protein
MSAIPPIAANGRGTQCLRNGITPDHSYSVTRKTNAMTKKRESLMYLTPRHLDSVQSMAMGKSTIAELQESLTKNFNRYFPQLRKRKRDRVPSDALREEIMVRQILNRVQECRDDPDRMERRRTELARDVAMIRAYEAKQSNPVGRM